MYFVRENLGLFAFLRGKIASWSRYMQKSENDFQKGRYIVDPITTLKNFQINQDIIEFNDDNLQ